MLTDGRTNGRTEIWTVISHPAISRCDKKRIKWNNHIHQTYNLDDSIFSLNFFFLKEPSSVQIDLQVNLIITLSLGSMKTDRVISEPCFNEVIYNRHIYSKNNHFGSHDMTVLY